MRVSPMMSPAPSSRCVRMCSIRDQLQLENCSVIGHWSRSEHIGGRAVAVAWLDSRVLRFFTRFQNARLCFWLIDPLQILKRKVFVNLSTLSIETQCLSFPFSLMSFYYSSNFFISVLAILIRVWIVCVKLFYVNQQTASIFYKLFAFFNILNYKLINFESTKRVSLCKKYMQFKSSEY